MVVGQETTKCGAWRSFRHSGAGWFALLHHGTAEKGGHFGWSKCQGGWRRGGGEESCKRAVVVNGGSRLQLLSLTPSLHALLQSVSAGQGLSREGQELLQ